ncbi:MAG: hypothetical protein FWD25_12290 [Clostridia bacterium]|nr:hypothetical protein [Clostridia bacterium]
MKRFVCLFFLVLIALFPPFSIAVDIGLYAPDPTPFLFPTFNPAPSPEPTPTPVHALWDEPYELWGLPFGCSVEECVEYIFEKKGIVLVDRYRSDLLRLHDEQRVSFLGKDIDFANFHFNLLAIEGLAAYSFAFVYGIDPDSPADPSDQLMKLATDSVDWLRVLVDNLSIQYGNFTGYSFETLGFSAEWRNWTFENDEIDYDAIWDSLVNNDVTSITIGFRNASASINSYELIVGHRFIRVSLDYTAINYEANKPEMTFPVYRKTPAFTDVSVDFD